MPELPDLYVFSQNLKKRILNRNIVSVTAGDRIIGDREAFCESLTGTVIRDIVREGKELHFLMGNGNSFGVHLMISGEFSVCNKDEAEKINRKIAEFFFEDGGAFVISDFQHLCRVTLSPVFWKSPDALSDKFTFEYLSAQIKKKPRVKIKPLLIDQSVVRGIGNAYVDEILWKANISPESVSGKIPEKKLKDLVQAVPFVLNEAIGKIQQISPDIISGEERGFLKVHNPHRKSTDDGGKITVKKVAGKMTYFTGKQELFR